MALARPRRNKRPKMVQTGLLGLVEIMVAAMVAAAGLAIILMAHQVEMVVRLEAAAEEQAEETMAMATRQAEMARQGLFGFLVGR